MKLKHVIALLLALTLSVALVGTGHAKVGMVTDGAKLKQALINCDAANLGDIEIVIAPNATIEGNFVVSQRNGTNVTIKGDGSTTVIKGQIQINGHSADTGSQSLTVKDLIFDATGLSVGYMIGQSSTTGGTDSVRYPRNVTVDGCTFIGNSKVAAINVAQPQGFVTVTNCTAEGMHSLLQASSCGTTPITVDGCTVKNTTDGSGVSLGNARNAKVNNCTFEVSDLVNTSDNTSKYAVRINLDTDGDQSVLITNNTFKDGRPIVVRKPASDAAHSITVTGNTYSQLTVEEADEVIWLEDNATSDMFTGEEQAKSDTENTFLTESGTNPAPNPNPNPNSSNNAASVSTPPKSGDNTNLACLLLLLALSLAGAVCFGKKCFTNR